MSLAWTATQLIGIPRRPMGFAQQTVLCALESSRRPMSIAEIALACDRTASAVSKILVRLHSTGRVRRSLASTSHSRTLWEARRG